MIGNQQRCIPIAEDDGVVQGRRCIQIGGGDEAKQIENPTSRRIRVFGFNLLHPVY